MFLFEFTINSVTYNYTTNQNDVVYLSKTWYSNNGLLDFESQEKVNNLENRDFSFNIAGELLLQVVLSVDIYASPITMWYQDENIDNGNPQMFFTGILKGFSLDKGIVNFKAQTNLEQFDYKIADTIDRSNLTAGNTLFDDVMNADASISVLNADIKSLQNQIDGFEADKPKWYQFWRWGEDYNDSKEKWQSQLDLKNTRITNLTKISKANGAKLPIVYGSAWVDGIPIRIGKNGGSYIFTKSAGTYSIPSININGTEYPYLDTFHTTDPSGGNYRLYGTSTAGGVTKFEVADDTNYINWYYGDNSFTDGNDDGYVFLVIRSVNANIKINSLKVQVNNPAYPTINTQLKNYLNFAGIDDSKIDLTSFASNTSPYLTSIVLDANKTVSENIQILLKDDMSTLSYIGGKYVFSRLDNNQTVVKSFNEDNFLERLKFDFDYSKRIGKLEVKFSEFVGGKYQDNSHTLDLSLLSYTKAESIEVSSVNPTTDFLDYFASTWLDLNNNAKKISFKVPLKDGYNLKPDDLISISYDEFSFSDNKFYISNININPLNSEVEIKALEYSTAYWDSTAGFVDSPISFDNTLINIPTPTNLTTDVEFETTNGLCRGRVAIRFEHIYDYNVEYFLTLTKDSEQYNYNTTTKEFIIKDLPSGVFDISIVAKNDNNYLSSALEGTIDVEGSGVPSDPYSFVATEDLYETSTSAGLKSKVTLSWQYSGVCISYFRIAYKKTYETRYQFLETDELSIDIMDIDKDTYNFTVQAVNGDGIMSNWTGL